MEGYDLLRNLCAPTKPSGKGYDELCKLISQHCNPKPSVIMQRFEFHNRTQTDAESAADYLAALRRLAAECKFGTVLDETLRDRLVCGINNPAAQRKMLSDNTLTLEKAIAIAGKVLR